MTEKEIAELVAERDALKERVDTMWSALLCIADDVAAAERYNRETTGRHPVAIKPPAAPFYNSPELA